MEPNQMESNKLVSVKTKMTGGDFLLNIGTIIALYTIVGNIITILFIAIDKAFPKITTGYNYSSFYTPSISMPVSIVIVLFPVFWIIMWLLEKSFSKNPEKRNLDIHKGLTYITLFLGGAVLVGDLVTVVYYFIDGQDLTPSFILKVLSLLIITAVVFLYYIADVRNKLTLIKRKIWLVVSLIIVLASIIFGFSVLGSPRTQQLLKYDQQKVSDLQILNNQVLNYYSMKGYLPGTLAEMNTNYYSEIVDIQTQKPYEYNLIGQSAKAYSLCAVFNKASPPEREVPAYSVYNMGTNWVHPAGHYCFNLTIPISQYKTVPNLPIH